MIIACLFGALCGASFYQALRTEPGVSPLAGVLVRILANLSCLVVPFLRGSALPKLRRWRGNRGIWCWGVLGAISTTCYYLAVPLVGSGLTMFLNAGSGIFVAALAPKLTGQRTARAQIFGALGSFAGLYLLCLPSGAGASAALGGVLALLAGFFGGVGYLLVARARAAYRPETVMLHWTFVNLVAYAGFLFFYPPRWPTMGDTWLFFVVAGLCAAASQYFTSLSYQKAPAALAGCLSYLCPVLGLAVDALAFGFRFGPTELTGAALVIAFGVAMPILKAKRPAAA